jgi:DNA-binding NarL/FixJ family response regulator
MNRTRILLADDHVMLLEVLVTLLEQEFEVVGTAQDGRVLVDMAARLHPEVVVADIEMPQLSGIEAARAIREESNSTRILFLSMYADLTLVEEAFQAGASGYMLKVGGADELVKAIQCVAHGGRYVTPLLGDLISTVLTAGTQHARTAALTSRQREVLQLLAAGNTMKQIGQQLNISPRTIESHKYEVMRNFGLKTTAELIRYAVRNKLL